MTSSPTILLVTRDRAIEPVVDALQAEGLACKLAASGQEAQRLFASAGRWVAVLDGELADDPSFPLHELLERARSVPTLLLIRPGADLPLVRDPLRTAHEEYALKPIAPEVLMLRIKALLLAAGFALPAPPSTVPSLDVLEFADSPRGRLTVVFSVKGGAGKSTIAVNLGVGLADLYGLKTLLVDADLWFGDIGVLLNVASAKSSFDLCARTELDLFALPKSVVSHPSGLGLLLRPPDPLAVERFQRHTLIEALDRYRSLFEHIVVDTHSSLDELNLDLLDAADRILLVVTPEMGAVHNTTRFLAIAERLGHTDKLTLILNRANSGIEAEALERTLRLRIAGRVISAGRAMLEAVNEGASLFAKDPERKERVTQDMAAVVKLIADGAPPRPQVEQRRMPSLPAFLRRSA